MAFDITPYVDMSPKKVRELIRKGVIDFPTAGMCRGYAQANMDAGISSMTASISIVRNEFFFFSVIKASFYRAFSNSLSIHVMITSTRYSCCT